MLSYIGIPTQKRGKFLPEVALKLGGNPRMHFKQLCEGKEVKLENGTVVKPSDVLEPQDPAEGFVINYVPDVSFIDSVVNNSKMQKYLSNENNPELNLDLVYHSVDSLEVFLNDDYLHFMSKFGKQCHHVVDGRDLNHMFSPRTRAVDLAFTYKAIFPKLFPLQPWVSNPTIKSKHKEALKNLKQFKLIDAEAGLDIGLYPKDCFGPEESEVLSFGSMSVGDKSPYYSSLRNKSETHLIPNSPYGSNIYNDIDNNMKVFSNEPELTFFGTISMRPGVDKCSSGIYFNIPGQKSSLSETRLERLQNTYGIMMDGSEGTYGQIYDHLNDMQAINALLSNLKGIYITHMHGDHHLGTLKILSERDRALSETYSEKDLKSGKHKIYVVIPYFMDEWIKLGIRHLKNKHLVEIIHLHELNPEPKKHYDIFDSPDSTGRKRKVKENLNVSSDQIKEARKIVEVNLDQYMKNLSPKVKQFYQMLSEDLKINRIYAVEALHGYEAYGCMVESEDWSIFYTGDTRPNLNHLQYASGTTLLIHEATFEKDLQHDAEKKFHSTTTEAMKVGNQVSAWRTCLTHFSLRYSKIPPITEENFSYQAMGAVDHLTLKLSDFDWAYKTLDIFNKQIFN